MKAVVTVAATLGVLGLSACGSLTTPATQGPSDDDPRPSVRNPDPDALRPDAHRR
jgi:hypothetical protein